ncbi:MAG: ATP synthase F0 subunit B [Geitlerinemataceae cyanobacterium]
MLRQDSAGIEPQPPGTPPQTEPTPNGVSLGDAPPTKSVDIQRELSRLEEMILESPRVPFTRRTLIDEEKLLDHLDKIRLNLPGAFQDASELLRRQEEILQQAEQYAREVVEAAQQQANGILDEMGIVRQAKVEADRVRQQVQIDCETAEEQTLAEIEQLQLQAQQELEAIRARAIAEAEAIETGADEYADRVLGNIEQQFSEMLHVIRNGRQQLQQDSAYRVHDKSINTD